MSDETNFRIDYSVATRNNLRSRLIQSTFLDVAPFHDEFFRKHDALPLKEYPWPKQPLYEWSRRLEYPWVINQIRDGHFNRVLDAGSGVTFLPFYLASVLDAHVDCVDSNPDYPSRFSYLNSAYGTAGNINYYQHDISLPFPPNANKYDCVICVSVIEHLETHHRDNAIRFLLDKVAEGGKLLLTLDVALDCQYEGIPSDELDDFVLRIAGDREARVTCSTFADEPLLTQQTPFPQFVPYRESGSMYDSNLLLSYGRWRNNKKKFVRLACALIEIAVDRA